MSKLSKGARVKAQIGIAADGKDTPTTPDEANYRGNPETDPRYPAYTDL